MFAFPRKTIARPGHVGDLDKVILKALATVPRTENEPRNENSLGCCTSPRISLCATLVREKRGLQEEG